MQHHDDLVPHMRRVYAAEGDLRELGALWQMIESSASISCPDEVAPILPTLVGTRERFNRLRHQLIEQMAAENVAELADGLGAKAQCAIDILVRNLYERTADVGFLATDDVVRRFCEGLDDAPDGPAMSRRLAEYQAKYSVYDDVLLLCPQGRVLARLREADGLAPSRDTLVAAALSANGHVERFAPTDLCPDGQPALLYAHRIEGQDGRPVGVLVLRFRFADEMARIFERMEGDRHGLALTLLDDQRRVIASHDHSHVPPGTKLPDIGVGQIAPLIFSGREYLGVCCSSAGYQGYAGPPWQAMVMISVLTAFRSRDDRRQQSDIVPLDNSELSSINAEAGAINRDLRLVVWNGRLMAGSEAAERSRLKAVLAQVGQAGRRTRERVDEAIREIYATSIERAQSQARELARLAADILDRNLYERANDCRWWALTPVFRQLLPLPDEPGHRERMAEVLDHINGLYTVYNRLVVFDLNGRVRAASRADSMPGAPDRAVPEAWVQAVRQLSDAQRYAATAHEDTDFHAGGSTWVYLAAIRAVPSTPQDRSALVGGIAIVFNARTELAAMLKDVLGSRAGFAAFVDDSGRVLSSTDEASAEGSLATLREGPEHAVVAVGDTNLACARQRGQGYREFRCDDGYDHGVQAIVGLRLGVAERRRTVYADVELRAPLAPPGRRRLEVSLFQVGPGRYALPSAQVLRAVSMRGQVKLPGTHGMTEGLLEVMVGDRPVVVPVLSGRRMFGVRYAPRAEDGVVVLLQSPSRPGEPVLGLRVDDILAMLEFDVDAISPPPEAVVGFAPWVQGILSCDSGDSPGSVLVPLLDAYRLVTGHESTLAEQLVAPVSAPVAEPGRAEGVAAQAA